MKNPKFAAPAVLLALAGLACSALATNTNETEANETKALANPVVGMVSGDTITGSTTGTSTTTAGAASADTFRIKTAPAALGIYRHQLVLTTTGTAGHSGSIRGLSQTGATAAVWNGSNVGTPGTTDASMQASSTTTTPARTNVWFGFGKEEEVYYRVTGSASTTSPYVATLTDSVVTPIAGPSSIVAGNVTISTIGQTTEDTDFWLYDSNFNAILGAGCDDESVNGGGTGANATGILTRNLAAGTYYLAVSRYNMANNQCSPADDDFRTGTILDFPNAVACSSTTTTAADLDVLIGGNAVTVLGAASTGFEVKFVQFTVVPPTSPTPPTGVGSATPSSANNCGTGSSLLKVTTTPGANPASTGIAVSVDLSAIGGSASQTFYDDGSNGDVTIGDGVFSYNATVSNATVAGGKTLPFVVSDAQARSSNGNVALTVTQCPPANDECANATVVSPGGGSFPFNVSTATVSAGFTYCAGSGGDVFFSWTAPQSGTTVVDTCGVTGDSVVAVFASCAGGANIACNDDADPPAPVPCDTSLASYLSFTATQGTTYIIGVRQYGATATSGNLNITAPTGINSTSAATPNSVFVGTPLPGGATSTLLTCQVFPATTPPSTGVTVTTNLSAFGGSAAQSLYDNGTNGDVTSGDGTFSYAFTPTATGSGTLTFSVADLEGRTHSSTASLTANEGVLVIGPAVDTNNQGYANLSVAANQVRWVQFTLACDVAAANGHTLDFDTNLSTGGPDTEIGLYTSAGNLVSNDDDDGSLALSAMSFGQGTGSAQGGTGTGDTTPVVSDGRDGGTLTAGTYYMAVGTFNTTFNATGFGVTSTGSAASDVKLNFSTNLTCGPVCDSIDFNNDGLFPDTTDIDDFLSVFSGGACSNDPNCGDIDFNNDGLFPDTTDIDSLLSVFSGGPCI